MVFLIYGRDVSAVNLAVNLFQKAGECPKRDPFLNIKFIYITFVRHEMNDSINVNHIHPLQKDPDKTSIYDSPRIVLPSHKGLLYSCNGNSAEENLPFRS